MVAMSLRTRRRLLICVNAILALGVAVCLCVIFFLSPKVNLFDEEPLQSHQTAEVQTSHDILPLDAYAVIHRRNLRAPLYDPKVVIKKKAPPKKPRFRARLVGAVVEPGFTYGIFRTDSGRDKLVSVGDTVEGAELTAIAEGSATLKFHGELITLQVPKKEAGK